jgi:MFS family permease
LLERTVSETSISANGPLPTDHGSHITTPQIGRVTVWLIIIIASIGFLFDTYELLMFPVIGSDAIAELKYRTSFASLDKDQQSGVRDWAGRMLWIAALSGGAFGLLGGWLIDRLGRKTIMVSSILIYSFSPVAAAYSTELWQLVLFRSTTFIGVCVQMVAAVTWLAELFENKRTREIIIGWTLATASLGGILVTEVYNTIVDITKTPGGVLHSMPFPAEHLADNIAWRFTLLTGLIPGAAILLLMPFVPESLVWKRKKQDGTLRRPSFLELFSPGLLRTTLVTTLLSACGYAAAFGAIQLTPLQIAPGLPDVAAVTAAANKKAETALARSKKAAKGSAEETEAKKELAEARTAQKEAADAVKARRGNIQRWQELGGLAGRILLAILLLFVPSRPLIQLFLVPGVVLLPLTYWKLVTGDYAIFATAIFFCGLLTVAQFSFLSEFLPRVFPLHLRGTGGSFATNFGGRMIGTMAATLNTEVVSKMFSGSPPMQVASAAAVIGGSAFLIALGASFLLPSPVAEGEKLAREFGSEESLEAPKAEPVR